MIVSAYLLRYDGKNAFNIWRRDRHRHVSPNAAQTEAVCAGALEIRLAGPAVYHGVLYEKPYIGENTRTIETADIIRVNRLMSTTSFLMLAIAVLFRAFCLGVLLFETI